MPLIFPLDLKYFLVSTKLKIFRLIEQRVLLNMRSITRDARRRSPEVSLSLLVLVIITRLRGLVTEAATEIITGFELRAYLLLAEI